MEQKVKRLLDVSRQVILDCALENGAIVAANCFKEYYPKEAKHYLYVWPRDASFACVAADILGLKAIPERFFDWCLDRAEGFSRSGIFLQSYFVNGPRASGCFQPDQTGSVLWALWHHFKDHSIKDSKYASLVHLAAEGLCTRWNGNNFDTLTEDLWEERFTFPDLEDNFTYSLAACAKGLEYANSLIPQKRWSDVAAAMRRKLSRHYSGWFFRSFGKLTDDRIDASTLGLVYPFELAKANDEKIVNTVKQIERKLVTNGGVHRYEADEYDGWMCGDVHRRKGAGAWPLLNFWMSIYYARLGRKDRARKYYKWVVDRVRDFIPEQIFENELQVSVKPLCWSHAMFVIASKELGYI